MDTRDIYKLVRELSEEKETVINLYDSMDIELNEGFVIETGVVGFTEDGVIVHLDEDAMEFLDFNGVLLENAEVSETAVQRFDYSAPTVGAFSDMLAQSDDPFELVHDALNGNYGDEVRLYVQEMYDDVVIDSQGRLHPDDDFEEIISRIVDNLDADYGSPDLGQDDELAAIKKLAHGDEEVSEGLGKALLGGAALIAAITGVNKMQANHMMKTEPQLITLAQMRQEAEMKGDAAEVEELDDRIQQTMDHISVTGRPVMDPDGKPADPRKPFAGESMYEAEYQGRKVPLNKPMQGDVKKSKVYVKKPDGKVVKVNFGDKDMRIKKSNPERRKSFRARHNCDNPGPKWKARYWSCKAW